MAKQPEDKLTKDILQSTTTTPPNIPLSSNFLHHNKIKSPYVKYPRHTMTFATLGRTKQSFKDECDINLIMKRYERTGVIDFINPRTSFYSDCPDLDFQAAMQLVKDAKDRFAALPSNVRDRFGNDPGKLLQFLSDPSNREEAIKLGLVATQGGQGGSAPQEGGAARQGPPIQSSEGSKAPPSPVPPPAQGG